MSDNYTFAGFSNAGYVPTLHKDLVVHFSMNPDAFPYNRYVQTVKVDKQKGYFIRFKNDSQNRFINPDNIRWADNSPRPQTIYGNEALEFPQFNCQRNMIPRAYGRLYVEQSGYSVLSLAARESAQQLCTARAGRIHTTITTTSNYPTANVVNASTYGATWANATSTNTAIRGSVMGVVNAIQQATCGTVTFKDLFLVMNPNTAAVVARSAEFVDFIKQQSNSMEIWKGTDGQTTQYNLPSDLFGLNLVVDYTVRNTALPNPAGNASNAYSFPDNTAVILAKKGGVTPASGQAFSTFMLFAYQDLETHQRYIERDQMYEIDVVDNVDDSFLFAPQTGGVIATNS